MRLLVVVDMQEDFVRGVLTVPGAEEIIPGIKARIEDYLIKDDIVVFTRDTHYSNVSPRIRMTILYTIAQSVGYRVAGTSNASELFIGWGTKWGDLASDINPISQLTCSEVISLGDYMGLPYNLIHKTPADGLTGKSDEENFGFTYKELDTLIVKQRNLTCTGRIQCAFTEQELKILKLHEAAYHVIKIHY